MVFLSQNKTTNLLEYVNRDTTRNGTQRTGPLKNTGSNYTVQEAYNSSTLTKLLNDGMPLCLIVLQQNVELLCPTNTLQVTLPPIQDDVYEMHQLVIQLTLESCVTC